MTLCPACSQQIPADSRFCGHCGFKLEPIPREAHRRLSEAIPPLREEGPILLTRVKGSPVAPQPRAQLEVVEVAVPSPAAPSPSVTPAPAVRPAPVSRPASAAAPIPPAPRVPVLRPDPVTAAPSPPVPTASPTPSAAPRAPAPRPAAVSSPPVYPAPVSRPAPRPEAEATPSAPSEARAERRWPRFPIKVEVGYGSEHNFYTGFLENLSSGGLFVATHSPQDIGNMLELTFSVPGLERSCTAVCQVRWVREYNPTAPDTVPGMGLQFTQLDSEARAAIELFIQHRDPIFFDDD